MATTATQYRLEIASAHAHRFRVTVSVPSPTPQVVFSLPVWIPGSYLVREFARHVQGVQARQGRRECEVVALDKTTWQVTALGGAALTIVYEVYAYDASVRAAYLDAQRAFFNGTSLFVRVHGRESQPHELTLGALPREWRVATSMAVRDARGMARPRAPTARARRFVAADYDAFVDHPFELGTFWRGTFTARGVPHEFVITGAWPGADTARLLAHTQRVCEAELDFWHGKAGRAARASDVPFERYVFMLRVVEDGYGGLEHRASTALIASRRDMPRIDAPRIDTPTSRRATPNARAAQPSDGYVTLLGLISHEYFHTWNVKRLKPRALERIDYTREQDTGLLWFFEGFTSYYDDLFLVRAGLVTHERYLGLLQRSINGLLATPGRRVQSVHEAARDAWTKYYRPDENTPNATVSYYVKGALVALALDLTLRAAAPAKPARGNAATLDAVMRELWRSSRGGGIDEADIARVLEKVCGRSMKRELRAWVHGKGDFAWDALLAPMGVSVQRERVSSLAVLLGLRLSESAAAGVQVKTVLAGGLAEQAGLSAGDEILAVDGWRVRKFDDALAWWRVGAPLVLTLVRDQRLRTLRVALSRRGLAPSPVKLELRSDVEGRMLVRRTRWLSP
jgi:predicted metalloprotease with PDZ domain